MQHSKNCMSDEKSVIIRFIQLLDSNTGSFNETVQENAKIIPI